MNGKKARLFRALASVTPETQANRSYHGVEHTVRNRVVKDPLGKIISRIRTATYKMNPCARVVYKALKAGYLRKSRCAL